MVSRALAAMHRDRCKHVLVHDSLDKRGWLFSHLCDGRETSARTCEQASEIQSECSSVEWQDVVVLCVCLTAFIKGAGAECVSQRVVHAWIQIVLICCCW